MRKPTNLQALRDFGTITYETYLSHVLNMESIKNDAKVMQADKVEPNPAILIKNHPTVF